MAEIGIREVHVDRGVNVIGAVENVEKLKPELENNRFCNVGVLVEVDVGLEKVGSPELGLLLIALLPEAGNGEVALGDGSREPGLVIG
jgi:hypothetical protein